MKAVKKYGKGGMRMPKYQNGDKVNNDPPRMTKNDLRKQVEGLKKERDRMLSSDFVRKDSMFAKANPKMSGLNFGRVATRDKTAGQITDYYNNEIKKIEEAFAKDNPPLKPYNREEFIRAVKEELQKTGQIPKD